ncbi:MAG TPA: ATP-binding protein [Thermoanaerobaculia bacterium]
MRRHDHDHPFLAGGGEMGALIRAHDWARSPLGDPAEWPQGLKTAVRFLLSTGHPMFIWWGPGLIQFYNDAYRRSIGPERHPGALGQGGRECWAEIWEIIGPQIEQVMAGRGHTWHENQLVPITRYGRREDVYWTYSYGPIDEPTAPNGIGGVLVVCTETTEQVLAEQRMKEAEARWRELFDQAPGFLSILSGPEHRFEYANSRYFELVGGRDIIGRTLAEALPEVASQGFVALLDEVYRSGEPHAGTAIPVTLAARPGESERQVYLDFVYQPIRDRDGAVTGVMVDGYDVTDRVIAHQSLRAEDRRKDEFLAMLAHELRNPLAPIRNASELLTRSASLDGNTRAIGELLTRQVSQLTRLVDDLLDVSRITQDRIELQRQPLDLADAVRLAVESVHPLVAERGHQVTVVAGDEPLWVEGDLARLAQCLANLLTNAAKYTPRGGRIEIALRRAGDEAVVAVTDDGVGIAPEMLPQVFELFVQAERSLDRSQGGLGIGLSLVRRLIEMHGGRVEARSEGLGHGSTFEVTLPRIDPPAEGSGRSDETAARPRRVLVVDDNPDAADSLALLLELRGHQAEAVHGARQALDRVREAAPEVVLLDIGMPEIDGYEVARRLRAAGCKAVLVAVTGYGRSDDVERARAAGFDAHVTKPVAYQELERVFARQGAGGDD